MLRVSADRTRSLSEALKFSRRGTDGVDMALDLRPAAAESGFTLVEILVVLVLIAIITGLGVVSIGSSRSSGQRMASVSVANAYAQAADRFARDHGGRYPDAPPSTDWGPAKRGPVATILGTKRFYLRQVPEAVQDGTVLVHSSASDKPSIVYSAIDGNNGYEIRVRVPGKDPCIIRGGSTNGATSGVEPC